MKEKAAIEKQNFEKYPELAKIIEWFANYVEVPGRAWNTLLSEINNALASPSPVQGMDEKDLIIHGLEEGAESWKAEYDNCRNILEGLVTLKEWKDKNINMDQYAKLKPLQWERAKEFLKKYQHE